MNARPHLVLFGFPIYFRPSILIIGALLVVAWGYVGAVIVATVAGAILVHELGHSLAFRRYGTESHIVIHIMGGYSAPDYGHTLDHREWVHVSLAGPGAAFLLLGLPAWIARNYLGYEYGYVGLVTQVLVWFAIYWGALNLLPIWPLDGGRVLYHGTEGNWELTRLVTVALSTVVFLVAWGIGYRFVAIFAAFNAYQVFKGQAPGGVAGNSRIRAAAKRAKAYAAKPTKTRGAAGEEAVELVYRELLRDRADRAAEPLAALRKSRHRDAADVAGAWGALLRGEVAPAPVTSPLLDAWRQSSGGPLGPLVATVAREPVTTECGPALVLLNREGRLAELCQRLAVSSPQRLRELEQLTLDLGLVEAQMQITGALDGA